jgi:hypothetical protein
VLSLRRKILKKYQHGGGGKRSRRRFDKKVKNVEKIAKNHGYVTSV